jgi:ribosomal protein S18 acetylase RimI-like enzyme
MKYSIRPVCESEYPLLEDFLFEAIFIPEGVAPPSREIIKQPELQVYVENFSKKQGDLALCAVSDQKIVGAVWGRIMNDYGHIDDETPSLAISLYKDYRGHGIGTALMRAVIEEYRKIGYKRLSLAVQKVNYAVKLYEKVGFKIVSENDEEYIMIVNSD